ncbi:Abc transporter i family member 6 protein [Thalictrum thalictroides]|uniref:Abc transporter i family member 6 protein n=1 Tax=Thalictrum thalictroides TaxID=46969 RepID=A0A7J6VK83_THATH|nr:Abc transporter i family member 6 protein [Thalictrum thalictroides]
MATSLQCQVPCTARFSSFKTAPSNSRSITLTALGRLTSSCHINYHHQPLMTKASLSVELPTTSAKDIDSDSSKILLEVKDLTAVIAETKQQILKGVNLVMREGEVHAVMGKNGSGKSTFSKVLVGHPDYEVTGGTVIFKGENLLDMSPEERSLAGLFMSFQSPVEIPGVSNIDFLHMAYNARQQKLGRPEVDPFQIYQIIGQKLELVKMDSNFLNRNVNEGFSGGEKKRNEILQLAVLGAEVAILDEIDSGLDVDALQDVAKAINGLLTAHNSVLMVTHYQRLLDYIKPKYVHIMEDGRIIKTGDVSIAKLLDKEGYKAIAL